MTRLKHELEMVHAEERREALDKLQAEHIEEIKVLTCRYGANEEELQMEVTLLETVLGRSRSENFILISLGCKTTPNTPGEM